MRNWYLMLAFFHEDIKHPLTSMICRSPDVQGDWIAQPSIHTQHMFQLAKKKEKPLHEI